MRSASRCEEPKNLRTERRACVVGWLPSTVECFLAGNKRGIKRRKSSLCHPGFYCMNKHHINSSDFPLNPVCSQMQTKNQCYCSHLLLPPTPTKALIHVFFVFCFFFSQNKYNIFWMQTEFLKSHIFLKQVKNRCRSRLLSRILSSSGLFSWYRSCIM